METANGLVLTTVADLIAKLQKCPADSVVRIEVANAQDKVWASDVSVKEDGNRVCITAFSYSDDDDETSFFPSDSVDDD